MRSVCRWGTPETELNVESTLSRFQRWAKKLVRAGPAPKRTEITVETDRVLIIRRRSVIRGWCQECACEVDLVNMEEAGDIAAKALTTLNTNCQSETWHLCEGPEEETLICLESVLKSM